MNYFEVYNSVWEFHKKYSEVKDTEEYWDEVIKESTKIANKYNKHRFVIDLLVVIINELERKCKERIRGPDSS